LILREFQVARLIYVWFMASVQPMTSLAAVDVRVKLEAVTILESLTRVVFKKNKNSKLHSDQMNNR